MKCFMYWTADLKSSKLWSSQLWTQFLSNCVYRPEKVRTSTGFEPVTSHRYRTWCLFLSHLSNLAVRNEFTELLFSTCARHCWNYCHFIFSRSCFRPEVSLIIIVKCNVNHLREKWQGSEMEDHVQPMGLVFTTMREWFVSNLKEVRVQVNALSVVKSFCA